jgi:hypothetical protein
MSRHTIERFVDDLQQMNCCDLQTFMLTAANDCYPPFTSCLSALSGHLVTGTWVCKVEIHALHHRKSALSRNSPYLTRNKIGNAVLFTDNLSLNFSNGIVLEYL